MVKKYNLRITQHAYIFILACSLVLLCLSLTSNPLSNALSRHDSSMFIYFGRGISDGMIPYLDMYDHKGIILFMINFVAQFIDSQYGLFIVEALFLMGSLIYLYRLLNLLIEDRLISALGILVSTPLLMVCLQGGNLSEEYALFFISGALYNCCLMWLEPAKSSILRLIVVGVFGGLTFFLRVNMVSVWLVFSLAFIIRAIYSKKYRLLIRQIVFVLTGVLIVFIAILVYGLMTNSLTEMIDQTFVLNFKYASVSTNAEKIRTLMAFSSIIITYGGHLFIGLYIYYLIAKTKSNQMNRLEITLHFIFGSYFLVNAYTVVLSGRDYLHYLMTQWPILVIYTSYGIAVVIKSLNANRTALIAAYILLLMIVSQPFYIGWKEKISYMYKPNQYAQSVEQMANFVNENSNDQDTIYVHNIDANLYNVSGRYSNSRYFVLPSLNYEQFTEIAEDFKKSMENNSPKFILINADVYESKQLNDTRLNHFMVSFIDDHYKMVPEFENRSALLFELQ